MTKNKIHEERMRRYFIDAAKHMLKGEGVQSLSVRSVADQAGYSYATMYNYFKDIDALTAICINEFIDEMKEEIKNSLKLTNSDEDIVTAGLAYLKYFVQYPSMFTLLYQQSNAKPDFKLSIDGINSILKDIIDSLWQTSSYEGKDDLKDLFLSYTNGYLVKNMHGKILMNYRQFTEDYTKQVNLILK